MRNGGTGVTGDAGYIPVGYHRMIPLPDPPPRFVIRWPSRSDMAPRRCPESATYAARRCEHENGIENEKERAREEGAAAHPPDGRCVCAPPRRPSGSLIPAGQCQARALCHPVALADRAHT